MGLGRIATIALVASTAQASEAPRRRLDAADVIEASLVARGGRARLARMVKTAGGGTIKDLTNGGSARFDWTAARPGELDYRMEPAAVGGFYELRVHDGDVTEHEGDWHDVTGSERDEALLDAQFDSDLRWRDVFPTVKLLGTVSFEGTPAYAVEMTSTVGRTRTMYYAVETYLPIGEDRLIVMDELHRPDTEHVPRTFTRRLVMSDFRLVNGVLFSFKEVRHRAADYLDEFEITTDHIDVELK